MVIVTAPTKAREKYNISEEKGHFSIETSPVALTNCKRQITYIVWSPDSSLIMEIFRPAIIACEMYPYEISIALSTVNLA